MYLTSWNTLVILGVSKKLREKLWKKDLLHVYIAKRFTFHFKIFLLREKRDLNSQFPAWQTGVRTN